jgi:starch-binding outer membrane protein, SusD/RagB family
MKTKILIIWLLGTLLFSCDDFLTVVPETALSSATFFKTESDFVQAVNAAYVPLRNIVNDRAWLLNEMHSDNTYYARNILFGATEQQEDIADFAVPTSAGITTNVHVLNQYRLDYLIIARCNQVLALIDGVDFDAARKANLKGQAHFLRAYAYFELVQYFGKVPLHLEPVTDRQGAPLPLAEVGAIYTQIISDATAATTELLVRGAAGFEEGRASSGAAKTLLGTVYMVQKDWAKAEAQFKDVVNSAKYSLIQGNYNNVYSNTASNKNNAESVFEVQFLEGAAGLNGTFMYNFMPRPMTAAELVTLSGTSNAQPLTGEGNNTPTPNLIAAYEPGDLRRDASIGYITISGSLRADKSYPYIKKFVRPHSLNNNHGMNWPIYRYAEVLLSLAESLNEQGKTVEATTYLDMIRSRAGLPATTAVTQAELTIAISKDRRIELAFENKRWFDLVRTGKAVETITAYGAEVKANPLAYYYPAGAAPRSIAFTNLELLYGLPADEAALNPFF